MDTYVRNLTPVYASFEQVTTPVRHRHRTTDLPGHSTLQTLRQTQTVATWNTETSTSPTFIILTPNNSVYPPNIESSRDICLLGKVDHSNSYSRDEVKVKVNYLPDKNKKGQLVRQLLKEFWWRFVVLSPRVAPDCRTRRPPDVGVEGDRRIEDRKWQEKELREHGGERELVVGGYTEGRDCCGRRR